MGTARQFEDLYPRAPRYVIAYGDTEVLRFAQLPKGSKTKHTRIVNISESGLAFLVPLHEAPELDETIKIEFTAPGSEAMACFAKVVRVELHTTYQRGERPQNFKLVAVEFSQIHPLQRQMLSQGLADKFREQQKKYERQQLWLKVKWQVGHLWRLLTRRNKDLTKVEPITSEED